MKNENYIKFKKGDRFSALLLGYSHTYRVKKVETKTVRYNDYEIIKEPVIITKSDLVWTTHICGALLSYVGNNKVDYEVCPVEKTWISYKLSTNERISNPYAIGEK